ncbi:hypothetical protein ABH917_001455 [Thermobifida halotolerans]
MSRRSSTAAAPSRPRAHLDRSSVLGDADWEPAAGVGGPHPISRFRPRFPIAVRVGHRLAEAALGHRAVPGAATGEQCDLPLPRREVP